MTILTRVRYASPQHGTMLPFAAYTKDMRRLPALSVWLQAAGPGSP